MASSAYLEPAAQPSNVVLPQVELLGLRSKGSIFTDWISFSFASWWWPRFQIILEVCWWHCVMYDHVLPVFIVSFWRAHVPWC